MMTTIGGALAVAMLGAATAPAPAPAEVADDCTGPVSDVRLFVTVSNVRSAKGLIAVTLYADDRSKFLAHHGSLYVGRVAAVMPTTRVCIHVPATGVYGLAVYHDEDGNRKFKRSTFGLPAEGYGFSNNASTFLGLPSFSSVRLPVPRSGTETGVRLKYP
ncbi:DUF2141 domain-containing protein [Sphingomonas bacterium]|uniref:DUF2141 domain-containing protein n=1 Tax=Sphingomonas bacterium TaxID=1895847 RepID=UPI0020C6A27C|nr:DUF2141 domain-containing protein [Sphingomonas bacterium]